MLLAAVVLLAGAAAALCQPLPPSEPAAIQPPDPVPPIMTMVGWDSQPDADSFSVVVGNITNVTTSTNILVPTKIGTNKVEVRAHKGTLASNPLSTNIVVSVDKIVAHWPETSASATGPWIRQEFGSVTNPNDPFRFVRVGQSITAQTNKALKP